MIYLLDTNTITDLISGVVLVTTAFQNALSEGHLVTLCDPIRYEVMRGLLRRGSTRKQQIFQQEIVSRLAIIPLEPMDWAQAAQFWADATNSGKQLSDVDLLLAALASRLNATISSSDLDFDTLPIQRLTWRGA